MLLQPDLRYRDVRSPLGIKPISLLKRYLFGPYSELLDSWGNLKILAVAGFYQNLKLFRICHESVVFSSLHVGLHNLCSSFTFHPLRNDRSAFLPSLQVSTFPIQPLFICLRNLHCVHGSYCRTKEVGKILALKSHSEDHIAQPL